MQYHYCSAPNLSHPAGGFTDPDLWVDFNRQLKSEFRGGKTASDAELVADRALDEDLGLTGIGGAALQEHAPRANQIVAAVEIWPLGPIGGRKRCRKAAAL